MVIVVRTTDTPTPCLLSETLFAVGKIYGQWPGLKNDQLYEGRDLALTTDFRDVFGEVARKHLRTPNLQAVFPGYVQAKRSFEDF